VRALVVVLASLVAAGCMAPLQIAPAVAVGRGGIRPELQVTGGIEGALFADHAQHEAVWLGSTLAYEQDLHSHRFLVGPQVQLSRVSDPRSRFPGLEVVSLGLETGGESAPEGTRNPNFLGGSLSFIHGIHRIPFTLSFRAGNLDSGPNRGFYGSIGIGVVAGSPLYWMQ
jgi:hypothetical protein